MMPPERRRPAVRTADFDYHLPPELIAAHPVARRDSSRLLVVERGGSGLSDRVFSDLPELLRPGDCLVLNDSRVIPARLIGVREGRGRAEVLLCRREGPDVWRALVRPGRKLEPGKTISIPESGGSEPAAIVHIEEILPDGERLVRIESNLPMDQFLNRCGEIPLPPYILAARKDRGEARGAAEDRERYQTVYAEKGASVAAPTAGLHFTNELLDAVAARGVEVCRVTLDVGPGTFSPVKTDDPRDHPMHEEHFSIGLADAEAIDAAVRDPNRRVIAVGTTVTRVLESLMQSEQKIAECDASTRLMILPGFQFRAVDALITNFHLPRSTLLMLVCALAGTERMMAAYSHAVEQKYRFYSYGDAMLIG